MKPREHFQGLPPVQYSDNRVPAGKERLQLSQNESMFGIAPTVAEFLTGNLIDPSVYPDRGFTGLRQAIAETFDLNVDQIWCGAGSTTLLFTLATLYLEKGRSAVCTEYGYQFFRRVTSLNNAQVAIAAEKDFTVDVEAILGAVRPDTSLVFLANPGNPTGTHIPRRDIEYLRDNLRDDILLILDEAYDEYVDPAYNPANFDLVDRGNTAVIRTFSKVYGLAGLRIGWGYFPPATMELIGQVKIPNATSTLSVGAAEVAVKDQGHVEMVRRETGLARERFTEQLEELGLAPIHSHTNFILCHFGSRERAESALAYLRSEGIVIRPVNMYGLHDYLRFSVGTQAQMDRVAQALADWRVS